jgi:hypothetical protein
VRKSPKLWPNPIIAEINRHLFAWKKFGPKIWAIFYKLRKQFPNLVTLHISLNLQLSEFGFSVFLSLSSTGLPDFFFVQNTQKG